jgi:hypothetical protein
MTPLCISMALLFANANSYFGLGGGVQRPSNPAFLDPQCERDTLSGPPCVYEFPNAKFTALLIGDSHAGHLSESFIQAAHMNGFNAVVWAHAGCRLIFVPTRYQRNHCYAINQKTLAFIKESKPDVVIASQLLTPDIPGRLFRQGLLELRNSSTKLFLVGNTPVFPDGEIFFRQNYLLLPDYRAPEEFPLAQMEIKFEIVSNSFIDWAIQNNIDTITLRDLFCDDLKCWRKRGGNWLFRDGSHLSIHGASLATPKFYLALKGGMNT